MTRCLRRASPENAAYELWSRDRFDREANPLLDKRGEGLLEGLGELWSSTLHEGLHEGGAGGFIRFWLVWRDPAEPDGGGAANIDVEPFGNDALAKLRKWLYGERRLGQEGAVPELSPALPDEQRRSILLELAETHAALLPCTERVVQSSASYSESSHIALVVQAAATPEELVLRLRRLRAVLAELTD